MHILSTIIQNPRFSHPLRIIAVYLVISCLTMGVYRISHADFLPSEETPDNSLLYNILLAEIAASRDMKQSALQYYLKAIKQTNDPVVAEASTLLAVSLEAPNEALFSAEQWAKQDPRNLQAQMVAMTLVISQSVEAAIPYLTKIITLDPTQNDHALMEVQSRLSDGSAKNLNNALNKIASLRTNDPYAHLIAAESAAELRDLDGASHWVDSALKLKPDLTQAIELKARLIRHEKDSDTPALHFIKAQLEKFPNNKELRFFYASALLDGEKAEEAKTQLSQLIDDPKYGGSALLVLADLSLQEKNWKKTSELLTKAQKFPETADGAEFLLGQSEEQQGNITAAITRYSNVSEGPYHIPATLRAIGLLREAHSYQEAIYLIHNSRPNTFEEQKKLLLIEIDLLNVSKSSDEAMQLTNDVLVKLPDDEDFLLMRAVTATKLQKWELAETDLKQVLKQNPNNANALNTLGYVLSFNKQRLDEAQSYIAQALSLSPNNPAFMDTMGWIYYQLGDYKQSVHYLKMALDLNPNPQIAAHLGEALWFNNQQSEAKATWKKALAEYQNDEELLDTLKRLNVDLKN